MPEGYFGGIGNFLGKGENASYLLRLLKVGLCGKGLTYYQMTNFRLFQTERVSRRQFQIS